MRDSFLLTKIVRIIIYFLLFTSAGALTVSAVISLNWRYFHDVPIMIYCSRLIDSGFIPYKDFFDMNTPGIYFVNLFAAKILGWSDLSFRIFDILSLGALLLFTVLWLRPLGKLAAMSAALLFGLSYLNYSPYIILQREYLALLPLAIMLWLLNPGSKIGKNYILLLSGILAGICISIKPQFILFSLSAAGFFIFENKTSLKIKTQLKFFLSGILTPLLIIMLYLIFTGSLNSFLEIAMNYWNLYTDMNGDHQILEGYEKFSYSLKSLFDGFYTPLFPLSLIGILIYRHENPKSKFGFLLIILLTTSVVYPLISGQFFDYHWIPFSYFSICAASYIVKLPAQKISAVYFVRFLAILILFVPLLKTNISYSIYYQKNKDKINNLRFHIPDEITDFLRKNLKEGDKVQPLDWTGGAVHAMLNSNAALATRFIYDFHFYHHINSPYIDKLKKEFIQELSSARPEYIIQVIENRPWPGGPDTSRDFVELKSLLEKNYVIVKEGDGFRIYKVK